MGWVHCVEFCRTLNALLLLRWSASVSLPLVRNFNFMMRLILQAAIGLVLFLAGILPHAQPALALQPTSAVGVDEDPNCRDTKDKCKFWAEIGKVS